MAWGFWRQPVEGKHALGPAVRAIPSAPLPPVPVVSVDPPPAPVVVPADPPSVAPPAADAAPLLLPPPRDLYDEIAHELVTGAAWTGTPSAADVDAVLDALAPAARAEVLRRMAGLSVPLAPAAPSTVQPEVVDLDLLHVLPVEVPAQASRGGAREALTELAATLARTADSGPRVELTFRDGTSTALDPESDSGLALQQLALSLTRRD